MSSPYGPATFSPVQSVAARVAHYFEADPTLQRVVVYRNGRSAGARLFVRPFVDQRLGPELVGVYSRDVRIVDLIADLAQP